MNEAEVKRLFKLAKFFNIKFDEKKMNIFNFSELIYDKTMEWEEENGREFPYNQVINGTYSTL